MGTARGWAYSYATNINNLGYFAIGSSASALFQIAGKVFLEGAYRYGSMADDPSSAWLFAGASTGYLSIQLRPMRQFYVTSQLPDSVVDWV
jgi:hypothetical protein